MACGKPIITNSRTRLADLVKIYQCGIVVDYGDVVALKRALLDLREMRELVAKLGTNGKVVFENSHVWSKMEERLDHFFESLPDAED